MNPSRTPIIAGNWKMYKIVEESRALVDELKKELVGVDMAQVEVVLCPPFTALHALAMLQGSGIKLGAQDVYWEEEGAFTGEVSPVMLADVNCSYVIVGHSERRRLFGDTDYKVNAKIRAALKANLRPIICVGETLAERESGRTNGVIKRQLSATLADLTRHQICDSIIAYEPVWAIGTGKTATAEQAQEIHAFIRKLLAAMFDPQVATKVRIQYGGSVKPANAKELLAQPDIDGALVGGASLKAADFAAIVKAAV